MIFNLKLILFLLLFMNFYDSVKNTSQIHHLINLFKISCRKMSSFCMNYQIKVDIFFLKKSHSSEALQNLHQFVALRLSVLDSKLSIIQTTTWPWWWRLFSSANKLLSVLLQRLGCVYISDADFKDLIQNRDRVSTPRAELAYGPPILLL